MMTTVASSVASAVGAVPPSFSASVSLTLLKVKATSPAVKGSPSVQVTPWRTETVRAVPSSFHS